MEGSQQQEEQKSASVPISAEKLPYTTYREYFDDSYKYQSSGKVLDIIKGEKDGEWVLILDKTIFHPQGGGQPSDEGTISFDSIVFTITGLKAKDDCILHTGQFSKECETFSKGTEVQLKVDGEKRKIYARYHSAGHLLDIAVRRVGQTHLIPGKGHHFPVGAYVEYIGVVDNGLKDKLPQMITDAANAIIKEKREVAASEPVFSKVMPYDEAGKILQNGIPPYIPAGQDFRVVKLTNEDEGCPCGGTHVKSVLDIVGIEVTKIVKKGKNTRVSYIVKEE